VDVRIGVQHSMKEIEVDLGDEADADSIAKEIEKVVADGTGLLTLTDKKGRRVVVAAAKVAYVEIGSSGGSGRVGFVR
jgi:hypothetical protein